MEILEREVNKIDIYQLCSVYVSEAFKLIKNGLSIGDFDNEIRGIVGSKLGLATKQVAYLHHSFHWAFFREDPDSPLECVDPVMPEEKPYVRITRTTSDSDRTRMVEYIIKKYGNYLRARINNLPQ
jgi:hypothetical protein